MKLKAKVADLGEIPGSLREFYDQPEYGGPWVLNVEAVDGMDLGEIESTRAEEERLWSFIKSQLCGSAIDEALSDAGGDRILLAPHLESCLSVDRETFKVFVTGDDGRRAFNAKGNARAIGDLIEDLRTRKGFSHAFNTSTAHAEPSSHTPNLTEKLRALKAQRESQKPQLPTGNPWQPSTRNLTHQMMIEKQDPTRAAQLRAAAEGAR